MEVNTEPEATVDMVDAIATTDESMAAARIPSLTVFDRCDASDCSAQAYVRARFPSGLELDFCGHHGHQLIPALAVQGAVIRDDSGRMSADRRLATGG